MLKQLWQCVCATAWRVKMLCSLVVWQQVFLYVLSDVSRVNTLWLSGGCLPSFPGPWWTMLVCDVSSHLFAEKADYCCVPKDMWRTSSDKGWIIFFLKPPQPDKTFFHGGVSSRFHFRLLCNLPSQHGTSKDDAMRCATSVMAKLGYKNVALCGCWFRFLWFYIL